MNIKVKIKLYIEIMTDGASPISKNMMIQIMNKYYEINNIKNDDNEIWSAV